jgi:hypothetical protein
MHSLLPCTSGSKLVPESFVSGGCQTQDEATETGNDDSQQVVDSPVKQPYAARLPQSGVTQAPSSGVVPMDSTAVRVVEATAGKSLRIHVYSFKCRLN